MLRGLRLLSGAALSAGLLWLFGSRGGKRRRAVARHMASSLAHRTRSVADVISRDLRNRAAGRVARIRSWIARRTPSDRFDPAGAALAVAGLGREAESIQKAISIQKMVDVAAPVRQVFEFWTRYDNWPRVMPHVREVREIALDRHRWIIAAPAGVRIEWITVITKFGTNRVIEWETVPTSAVQHTGSVRFRENRNGTTRVDIKMSYVPPAGAMGHAVAALFGADPKTAMNEDLARFKSLLEQGQGRAEGGAL